MESQQKVYSVLFFFVSPIGVGAQSTLGGIGQDIFVRKINNMPEFYMILARTIVKIPEFL